METFQQPKITGYRQLSEQEVALMNECKAIAEQVGAFVRKLDGLPHSLGGPVLIEIEPGKFEPSIDQDWVMTGTTQLQLGFMALTRVIAQPTTF